MPIACFAFSLFKVNTLPFSYGISRGMGIFSPTLTRVENGPCISWKCLLFKFLCRRMFLSYLGLKMDACLVEKIYILLKKMFFLKLNFQDKRHLHANCLFCILVFYRKYFYFQFLYIHSFIPIVAQSGRISS